MSRMYWCVFPNLWWKKWQPLLATSRGNEQRKINIKIKVCDDNSWNRIRRQQHMWKTEFRRGKRPAPLWQTLPLQPFCNQRVEIVGEGRFKYFPSKQANRFEIKQTTTPKTRSTKYQFERDNQVKNKREKERKLENNERICKVKSQKKRERDK